MARTQSVSDSDLIDRISGVFRRDGYSGASLASLAETAGLKKASLYHRFPGGKEQMAEEVLGAALEWYGTNILKPLAGPGRPRERLQEVTAKLDAFYAGGRQSCLLNMLASARQDESPFAAGIKSAFETVVAAFAALAREAGAPAEEAEMRAQRVVMLLHGSLVMSRGIGSGAPFQAFLASLPNDLIGDGS
jgi:TetR/AcrR family transcriptional regulator, lmrAB and yxaGH operons repressor